MTITPDKLNPDNIENSNSFTTTSTSDTSTIRKVVVTAVRCLGYLKEDTYNLSRAFGLVSYAIAAKKYFSGVSSDYLKIHRKLGITRNVMDFFMICNQIGYVVGGKYSEDYKAGNYSTLVSSFCFGLAGVGLVLNNLNAISLISLSNISASLGKVPILGIVTKTGMDTALSVSLGGGFTSCAVGAASKHWSATSGTPEKRKALLNLIWLVSEVSLQIIVYKGAAPPVLVALGATAAGLGIASYLYDKTH